FAAPGAPVTLESLSQTDSEALHRVIHDVTPAPRDASLRVCRRTWPLLSDHVPQSVPAWARGWSVRETFGPFESAERQLGWLDVRSTDDALSVVDLQTRQLLFTVPRSTFAAAPPPVGATRFEIPSGSIWLAAARFDARAPATALAGLRTRGGVLSLSQPPIV